MRFSWRIGWSTRRVMRIKRYMPFTSSSERPSASCRVALPLRVVTAISASCYRASRQRRPARTMSHRPRITRSGRSGVDMETSLIEYATTSAKHAIASAAVIHPNGRVSTPVSAHIFPIVHHQMPRTNNRSEEHTSELQSQSNLVCRLLLEKKKKQLHHDLSPSTNHSRNKLRLTAPRCAIATT